VDYYAPNGSVLTAETGVAHATNNLFVTPVGRVQTDAVNRPWARLAWAANRFYLSNDGAVGGDHRRRGDLAWVDISRDRLGL
jgi:hypothetical protein